MNQPPPNVSPEFWGMTDRDKRELVASGMATADEINLETNYASLSTEDKRRRDFLNQWLKDRTVN